MSSPRQSNRNYASNNHHRSSWWLRCVSLVDTISSAKFLIFILFSILVFYVVAFFFHGNGKNGVRQYEDEDDVNALNYESLWRTTSFFAVGVKNSPSLVRMVNSAKAKKLENVRIFALPSNSHFVAWLRKRKQEGAIPKDLNEEQSNPIVFLNSQEGIKILPSNFDFNRIRSRDEKPTQEEENVSTMSPSILSEEEENIVTDQDEIMEEKPTTTTTTSNDAPQEMDDNNNNNNNDQAGEGEEKKPVESTPNLPKLAAQVKLKNKIITGYRASEGKKFTNYKPFAQALTSKPENVNANPAYRNWRFVYQGPSLASIVLVQDLSSAKIASERNPKGLINNIGWGGQACLGGTKGAQIQCRVAKALKDGCSYDALGIQPMQYRLWIEEENSDFFTNLCVKLPNSLWILKPSGGQHGVGMSVHRGCEELKTRFYTGTTLKKYFVMQYLQPALLDGHKFDVRSYILVASLTPELVFYHDGFVRKATHKYSTENLKDTTAHITNSHDQDAKDDHFWDFGRLSEYLEKSAGFPARFMETRFRAQGFKVSNFVYQSARSQVKKKPGKFQLFAVDWIVDSHGRSHMLEVNANPLVSHYPIRGFPEIWVDLMDLVLDLQTGEVNEPLQTSGKRFSRKEWFLVFNSQEEASKGEPYNSCAEFENQPMESVAVVKPQEGEGEKPDKESFVGGSIEKINEIVKQEALDDLAIKEEMLEEKIKASGEDEEYLRMPIESWSGISAQNELELNSAYLNKTRLWNSVNGNFSCLDEDVGKNDETESNDNNNRKVCVLNQGKPDETTYTLIESFVPGPTVLFVSGMHGNEGAGIIATSSVSKHWSPKKGRFVVLERANPRGIQMNSRMLPTSGGGATNRMLDLNRCFPLGGKEPVGDLAKAIYSLAAFYAPSLLFDLHEGRAFYRSSSGHLTEEISDNVGSTTMSSTSKGSSVVCSPGAEVLARVMTETVNKFIKEESKRFSIIVPPIAGGLAAKLHEDYGTFSMVLETTLVLPLDMRVRQHLAMLSSALRGLKIVRRDFDFDLFPPPEYCIRNCGNVSKR